MTLSVSQLVETLLTARPDGRAMIKGLSVNQTLQVDPDSPSLTAASSILLAEDIVLNLLA